MAADLLEQSRRILEGVDDIEQGNPFQPTNELCEVADGVAEVSSFANVAAFTTDDGLVLVDTGSPLTGQVVHAGIRSWSPQRLNTAVYTHGHIDHVFGTAVFDEESAANGWERPVVVAHEDVNPRFDRYCLTAGYNAVINQRQFRIPGLQWPTDYRRPDTTYVDRRRPGRGRPGRRAAPRPRRDRRPHLGVGAGAADALHRRPLHLVHPERRQPPEGAALRRASGRSPCGSWPTSGPSCCCPATACRSPGRRRCGRPSSTPPTCSTASSTRPSTLMNAGRPPRRDRPHRARPRPTCSSGPTCNRSTTSPSSSCTTSGASTAVGTTATRPTSSRRPTPSWPASSPSWPVAPPAWPSAPPSWPTPGDLRLAGHLAELATQAAPDDPALHRVRADVFGQRARTERSLMARGVFSWAEAESSEKAGGAPG